MATYTASTRSNYFRVIDEGSFLTWCEDRGLETWSKDWEGGQPFHAISVKYGEGSWPSYDSDTDADIDFTAELAAHLVPTDIAILYEIGQEGLRYLVGIAIAVCGDGRTVSIDLANINACGIRRKADSESEARRTSVR